MSAESTDRACTIYISGIRNSYKMGFIRNYLRRFGNCKQIYRIYGKDGKIEESQRLRVVYAEPEGARKALLYKEHDNFFESNVTVSPTKAPIMVSEYRIFTGHIDPEHSPIYKLNDYCMFHLYNFLDLRSQYRLSRLCERFAAVFRRVFLRQYKSLHEGKVFVNSQFTEQEWRSLLKESGHMVESLTLELNTSEFIKIVPIYCPNLSSLTIYYLDGCNGFTKNIGYLNRIHTLYLYDVNIGDDFVQSLTRLDSLQVLRLNGCSKITGKHLESFKNLKRFSIGRCEKVEEVYLQKMFESTPASTLIKLSLWGCSAASEETIRKIVRNCHNLREISLNTKYHTISYIARLSNMEKLVVYLTEDYCSSWFTHLVTYAKDKLRVLELRNGCDATVHLDYYFAIDCVAQLNALEVLTLNNIEVNNYCLQTLTSLTNLKCFNGTYSREPYQEEIVDSILDFIDTVPTLEQFYLFHSQYHLADDPYFLLNIIDILKKKRPALEKPFVLSLGYFPEHLIDSVITPNKHIFQYDFGNPYLNMDDDF